MNSSIRFFSRILEDRRFLPGRIGWNTFYLSESENPVCRQHLNQLHTVVRDPFLQAMMEVPTDDEPISAEEEIGVEESWQEYRQGKFRSWEVVREELLSE